MRYTRVIDIVAALRDFVWPWTLHDPWADPDEARREYGLTLLPEPTHGAYDGIIVAMAHDQFRQRGAAGIRAWLKPGGIVFDVKGVLPRDAVDARL